MQADLLWTEDIDNRIRVGVMNNEGEQQVQCASKAYLISFRGGKG